MENYTRVNPVSKYDMRAANFLFVYAKKCSKKLVVLHKVWRRRLHCPPMVRARAIPTQRPLPRRCLVTRQTSIGGVSVQSLRTTFTELALCRALGFVLRFVMRFTILRIRFAMRFAMRWLDILGERGVRSSKKFRRQPLRQPLKAGEPLGNLKTLSKMLWRNLGGDIQGLIGRCSSNGLIFSRGLILVARSSSHAFFEGSHTFLGGTLLERLGLVLVSLEFPIS